MTAALLILLAVVAAAELRREGYLLAQAGKYPADLGWFATMTNQAVTWGWRMQWSRYETGPGFMARRHPAWLDWPRTLRVQVYGLTLLVYYGAKSNNGTNQSK